MDDRDIIITENKKQAYRDGKEKYSKYIQGQAIARLKPASRAGAVAAIKAGRNDLVKSYTGDRKESQADEAYLKYAYKKAKASGEGLEESVLDPYHEELCQELFNGDTIRDDVAEYILKSFKDWESTLGFPINVQYIHLVGSLLGHQYNATTDIDAHVLINVTDEEFEKIQKSKPACQFIPNTLHPIEISFQRTEENNNNAENIYDLIERKWIKRTDGYNVKIPAAYITSISKFFMGACDAALGQADVHRKQLDEIKGMEVGAEFSEEEKLKQIYLKRDILMEDRDGIKLARKLVTSLRNIVYREMSDFTKFNISMKLELPNDPHYTVNEMVFKMIEKYGYKARLDKACEELDKIIEEIDAMKKPIVDNKETLNRDDTLTERAGWEEESEHEIYTWRSPTGDLMKYYDPSERAEVIANWYKSHPDYKKSEAKAPVANNGLARLKKKK